MTYVQCYIITWYTQQNFPMQKYLIKYIYNSGNNGLKEIIYEKELQ